MPIGACTAKSDIMDWHKGAHASTFGGNPIALASALKTIELLQGGLVDNARDVGAYLEKGLREIADKFDVIGDVRGLGMMLGGWRSGATFSPVSRSFLNSLSA